MYTKTTALLLALAVAGLTGCTGDASEPTSEGAEAIDVTEVFLRGADEPLITNHVRTIARSVGAGTGVAESPFIATSACSAEFTPLLALYTSGGSAICFSGAGTVTLSTYGWGPGQTNVVARWDTANVSGAPTGKLFTNTFPKCSQLFDATGATAPSNQNPASSCAARATSVTIN